MTEKDWDRLFDYLRILEIGACEEFEEYAKKFTSIEEALKSVPIVDARGLEDGDCTTWGVRNWFMHSSNFLGIIIPINPFGNEKFSQAEITRILEEYQKLKETYVF